MKRAGRMLRTTLAACVSGCIVMALGTPHSGAVTNAAATAAAAPYVELRGGSSWSTHGEFVPWSNELSTAKSPISFTIAFHGSQLGREDLAGGNADFAISGVPFQPAELASVKGGASAFIAAPVQVSTVALYMEPPSAGIGTVTFRCDPSDPTTWPNPLPPDFDPLLPNNWCTVRAPSSAPVKIPAGTTAALLMQFAGSGSDPSVPSDVWNDDAWLKANGLSFQADGTTLKLWNVPLGSQPAYIGRSDPDEVTYYLQQYAKISSPDVWNATKAEYPKLPWDPITEQLVNPVVQSRDGAEQQLAMIADHGVGLIGTSNSLQIAGGIAPAPISMLPEFKQAFPSQPIVLPELQNANGDWVGPSVDAIDKAINAGGASPLYALTHKTPGAYPLTWVDNLYAPAHGLSIQKTEALAMFIRYLATTGQTHAAAVGEGQLSPALVKQSLAAADALVKSNCAAAGGQVVASADPGPLAPASAKELASIGSMLHCEPAPAPTTTTTTVAPTTSTTSPTFAQAAFGGGTATPTQDTTAPANATITAGGVVGVGTTAGRTTEATPTTSRPQPPRSLMLAATQLPLPTPQGASGLDRLATFVLGVLLFLLLRNPVKRVAKRVWA
jgi:hypothetical protein